MEKQVYKLNFLQLDKVISQLEFELINGNDNSNNNGKYKVEAIWDSAVYTKKLKDYLPIIYYLVF